MFYIVSGFYEAFYLWCEIGIVNFRVASWNVFIAGLGYYGVELCSDHSASCFCYVSGV